MRTLVLIPAVDVLIFCALGGMQHAPGPCVDILLLCCKDVPQLLWVNALGHIGVSDWADCTGTDAFTLNFKIAVNNRSVAGKPTDAFVARYQQERAERADVFNTQASYVKARLQMQSATRSIGAFCQLSSWGSQNTFTPDVQELTHALWHSRKRRDTLHAEVR